MTVQATPPLPDPVTGRIPPYTQVLEYDDTTSQRVIKYDVVSVPSKSTTVQLTSVQQSTTQQTPTVAKPVLRTTSGPYP